MSATVGNEPPSSSVSINLPPNSISEQELVPTSNSFSHPQQQQLEPHNQQHQHQQQLLLSSNSHNAPIRLGTAGAIESSVWSRFDAFNPILAVNWPRLGCLKRQKIPN